MRMRLMTLGLMLTATIASAQSAGNFEIAGFGRYTLFDDTLGLDNKFGGGGSLGFYLLRNLAIEGEGSYVRTNGTGGGASITNIPIRGRLTYHIPTGGNASAIRIGAGYVKNLYRFTGANTDQDGVTGVLGFRWGISQNLAFRMDGTADYMKNPGAGWSNGQINWGGQAGLSLIFGSSSDSDSDKDGVRNSSDRCPKTPPGKSVDVSGCASSQRDGDGDRVNDDTDRCLNTPPGDPVDSDGCSSGQKDGDRDGVMDTADRCPATPAGEAVTPDGCAATQRDDDGDHVVNSADLCPNTRAGDLVDNTGCGSSQRDSDKDGVLDGTDQCPNTPAGLAVNARGCSEERVRDGDADGVPDGVDRCPNTAKGQPIDDTGCPILFEKGAKTVVLRGVTFQSGRATLTPEARAVLTDIATQLVENPQYRIQISGHTDNSGSRAANLRLSLARARTVETYLEAKGVPPTQLTAKGFGPDVPIAPNKTAAGRAKNRRVELHKTN